MATATADTVRLTKYGPTLLRWNAIKREFMSVEINDIIAELRTRCMLAKGYTLVDLLRFVHDTPELADFIPRYTSCKRFAEYYAQLSQPRTASAQAVQIERLDLSRAVHITGSGILYMTLDLHGTSTSDFLISIGAEHTEETTYDLSDRPLCEYADRVLTLDPALPVIKHKSNGQYKVLAERKNAFSLLDVLEGVMLTIGHYSGRSMAPLVPKEAPDAAAEQPAVG